MKFIPALTIAFILSVMSLKSYGSNQLKYRIQCAISSENRISQKFKKIPELKTFTLPTGSKIYFSGGYFNKYKIAQKRLELVKNAGFDKAFIRVFKYNNLLSRSVGDSYIEKVKYKISLNPESDTLQVRDNLGESTSLASKKVYSRAEVIKMKKEIAERNSRKKEKQEALGVIIKNKQLNIEDISTNTIVNEAPVFKIFIGKHDNGTGEHMEFKELNNEIIYSYEGRKETKYAVGFYKNEKEANKNLPKYKNLIKESEIVGLYKGIIISLKLANELLEQFNKNYLPSKH